MRYWQQVHAIVWKDVMLERRTRQSVSTMLIFSIVVIITFNFALEVNLSAVRDISLGLLWMLVWVMGTLGIQKTFSAETDSRALDALLIAPIERSAIFFGKAISLFISIYATILLLIPLFIMFFNKPFWRPEILFTLFIGTTGYVCSGVFVGSMAVQTRSSSLLIPILQLPLTLPVLPSAAAVSAEFFQPDPAWSNVSVSLALILTYSLLMVLAGLLFYNYVIEE